jgi:hypothetical protein
MNRYKTFPRSRPGCWLPFLPLFCLFIASCQIMHVAPAQHAPCFTDKNQLEGVANLAPTGLHASLAYSPLKYLSVQASGLCNLHSTHFNNQAEGTIGGYFPIKRLLVGLNTGYGIGVTNYQRMSRTSGSYNYIQNGRFDSKKHFAGFHLAFMPDSGCWIGFSYKKSFITDFYHSSSTLNKGFDRYNYSKSGTAQEFNFFIRVKTGHSDKFYITINLGFAGFLPDRFDNLYYYPFCRIGYMVKL